MLKENWFYAVFVAVMWLASGCGKGTPVEERARGLEQPGDSIVFAAAWPFSVNKDLYKEGVQLAVEQVNANGGVLGRKLEVILGDDKGDVNQGRIIAQQFADNLHVSAVIGHYNSHVSLAASSIYQFSGLLMLSPGSTSPRLTGQGYSLVFRNVPHDGEVGKQVARYCLNRGYRRIAVLYVKNAYGRGLANAFENTADTLNMSIVDSRSYTAASADYFRNLVTEWKENYDFDAVFLAGSVPMAATLIKIIRETGVTVPVLGGDGLESPDLMRIAGRAAEGTVVVSFFHHDDPRPEVKLFVEAFRKKYGKNPDTWAGQSYDAVKLLAHAIQKAASPAPEKVAHALRSPEGWRGVTGVHLFNERGDVVSKPVILQIVKNGRFEFLVDSAHLQNTKTHQEVH